MAISVNLVVWLRVFSEERQGDLPVGPLLLEDREDNILIHVDREPTESIAEISLVTVIGGLESLQYFTGVDVRETIRHASSGMAEPW